MKARILRTDASISLAHAYPSQMKQIGAGRMARVKAHFLARSEKYARITWIKMLKAQVDAGTYLIDSRAIAHKIQLSHIMLPITEYEKNDISLLTQDDEPQE